MEQDSVALQQDKQRLESEAAELAQRLDAVMQDKFAHQSSSFDADTPIDKTLNFLQSFIAVSSMTHCLKKVVTGCRNGCAQSTIKVQQSLNAALSIKSVSSTDIITKHTAQPDSCAAAVQWQQTVRCGSCI